MQHPRAIALALAVLGSLASAAAPARADGPLAISVGLAVPFAGAARQIGGTDQLNVSAGLDLGPTKHIPLRTSVVFDYAGGAAGGGSLGEYGLGVGTRLNTPVFIGAAGFLYVVNASLGGALGSRTAWLGGAWSRRAGSC